MNECRLLVVDDNSESRGVVSEALTDQGYVISTAANGVGAIQAIAQAYPSVALVHVERSSGDGLAVLQYVREHAPGLPILVLGGDWEARAAAERIGAIGYVADPLNLGELVASVERICPLVGK